MPWYAVYDTRTGALISLGQEAQPPTLPQPWMAYKVYLTRPSDELMWDNATRDFIPRSGSSDDVDRWSDLIQHPLFPEFQEVYNVLNATRRGQLQVSIVRMLGSQRLRSPGESPIM